MDDLERDALGDPASQMASEDPLLSEPAKTEEPAQQAQSVEPADNGDFLLNPLSDPNLEAQRQRLVEQDRKMIASHTRKTMEREKQHRREMESVTAERQQLAAMMQQQNHAQQQEVARQESGPTGIAAHLSPGSQLQTEVQTNPALKEMFGAIDRVQSDQMKSMEERNKTLSDQLEKLQGTVQQQQQQAIVNHMRPQLEALQAKYGDALTSEVFQAATKKSLDSGLDLETALFNTSPKTVQSHIHAAARAEVQREFQERYGDLGALNGMEGEHLAQEPSEAFQPGEDFEQSFIRKNGLKAYREALAEGFE